MSRGNTNGDSRSVTEIDREIGVRIRKRRLELGLSQVQLGDAIGVTFQQVQKYECGVNRIAARNLMAIAKTLTVDPSALLPGATLRSTDNEEAKGLGQLVVAYTQLNDAGRRLLIDTAQTIGGDPQFKRT